MARYPPTINRHKCACQSEGAATGSQGFSYQSTVLSSLYPYSPQTELLRLDFFFSKKFWDNQILKILFVAVLGFILWDRLRMSGNGEERKGVTWSKGQRVGFSQVRYWSLDEQGLDFIRTDWKR